MESAAVVLFASHLQQMKSVVRGVHLAVISTHGGVILSYAGKISPERAVPRERLDRILLSGALKKPSFLS